MPPMVTTSQEERPGSESPKESPLFESPRKALQHLLSILTTWLSLKPSQRHLLLKSNCLNNYLKNKNIPIHGNEDI